MKHKLNKKDYIFIGMMTFLPFLQVVIFWGAVNINSIILPFQQYNLANNTFGFVGFDNLFKNFSKFITDFFHDPFMSMTFKNSLLLFVVGNVIMWPVHLVVSYCLYKKVLFSKFFTVMLFIPQMVSSVVFVLVFKYFVEYGIPFIVGDSQMPSLLSNPDTGFNILLVFSQWLGLGGGMIIYIGAMVRIPESIIEYGKIEGISALKEFWNVVLPMIFPTMSVHLITCVMGLFTNQFVLIPFYGTAAPYSMQTFGYYFFVMVIGENSSYTSYPYAAAASLVFTLTVLPISLFVKWACEKFGPNPEY